MTMINVEQRPVVFIVVLFSFQVFFCLFVTFNPRGMYMSHGAAIRLTLSRIFYAFFPIYCPTLSLSPVHTFFLHFVCGFFAP